MIEINNPEIQFAIDAVREAALLADRVQHEMVTEALTKEDRSPVTVADYAAQAVVARRLGDSFPEGILVGEEDSDALRKPAEKATLDQITHFVQSIFPNASSEDVCDWIDLGGQEPGKRFWTLDPVDGTKGFLRKAQYAVALALIEDGKVQIAVLGCPHISRGHRVDIGGEGSLVLAVRDKGCWTQHLRSGGNWKALQISAQDDRTRARLLRSAEAAHTDLNALDDIAQNLGIGRDAVRMDSQAKYSVLAAGEGELIFRLISPKMPDYKEKIWDQAVGSLLVEEAGGRVSDLDGLKLDFKQGRMLLNNRGVLASNGILHEEALEAIRAAKA
jgi:3'(2'), 5'-bisphosphate nucleotidase